MSEARTLVAETVERLFTDAIDTSLLARCEEGSWPAELWQATEETGISRALLGDRNGGAGGDWLDVFEIARAVGRHCVPLPLMETILGGWLLERAGLEVPAGPIGLVPHLLESDKSNAKRVPWGNASKHLVGLLSQRGKTHVACWERSGLPHDPGKNLALEPRDTLVLEAPPAQLGSAEVAPDTVTLFGAMLRCGQMTGALERLLDQTASYATERVQFGRAIGGFQAIQHELARLAGQVAEATMATEIAFGAAQRDSNDPTFEIACAKVVVGDAAEIGPRIAHQIHGAIGFTYEHSLHFATRRLWSWRTDFGTTEQWAEKISSIVLDENTGEIWPLVTSR